MVTPRDSCQYCYHELTENTLPDARSALLLRRYWWKLKKSIWFISILGPIGFVSKMLPFTRFGVFMIGRKRSNKFCKSGRDLDLQLGEYVEVRSAKEIFGTLDKQGKFTGLTFTPEMVKFCGKRFRVFRRLNKIVLEATGELRRIKSPTVILEGVFCDGKAHGDCDRSCFCFWREAWLKRIESEPRQR